MHRDLRAIGCATFAAALLLAPGWAAAQSPPKTQAPVAPQAEPLDPSACAAPDTHTTVGKGGNVETTPKQTDDNLSNKLARSNGVICPPSHVDPEIKAPTPPGGAMPVIPPPGSPGGDPRVQPK